MSDTRYYDEVTQLIGFNPDTDYGLFDPMPDENSVKIKKPLLETNDKGDLVFNIMDIHGNIITMDVSQARSKQKLKPIQLIRHADPGDGPKYLPAQKGQGVYPWISREIVEAFKEKRKVRRLILTEGYKKAFVACKEGILTIGLPGITVWKDKNSKEIFRDVRLFVEQCQVEDLLWLTDADTMTVRWEPSKDLWKRPNSFFTSVNMYKYLCRDWNVNQYYGYIHEDSRDKGLDDILLNNPNHIDAIKSDLMNSSGEPTWIRRINVSTMPYNKIQELFGIHHGVQEFYDRYAEFIGTEEFIYKNGVYQFDIEETQVKYLKTGESAQYIRVMKNYYMKAAMPTVEGGEKNTLLATDPGSIRERFKTKDKKEVSRIIYDIPFYDGFYNEPEHINYRSEIMHTNEDGFISKWYNKYSKLSHRVPSIDVDLYIIPFTQKFMMHIFGCDDIEYKGRLIKSYEVGYDYVQLLYLHPKQPLPILALVSRENETGKSKFQDWLGAIFQANARKISPEMLTGSFTEYFMSSLLIMIEEALFNRRETMERIKAMTTSLEGVSNGKFDKEAEVQTYIKFLLSSNNVDDFALISEKDKRFWVREIPVIKKEDYVIDFFPKLCDEIPLFLAYLRQRTMATDKDNDRLYFDMAVRHTTALERVIDGSMPSNEKLIISTLKDYFVLHRQLQVKLGLTDIRDLVGERNLELKTIRWVIESRMNKQCIPYVRAYKFFIHRQSDIDAEATTTEFTWRKTKYYTFNVTDYYRPHEVAEIYSLNELVDAEITNALPVEWKQGITPEVFYAAQYTTGNRTPPARMDEFIRIYNESESLEILAKNLNDLFGSNEVSSSNDDLPF